MKNALLKPIKDPSFWIDLCRVYIMATCFLIFKVKWYIAALFAFITAVIIFFLARKSIRKNRAFSTINEKMQRTLKKAKKSGDTLSMYKSLNEDLLPALQEALPQKIYKYYPLGDTINADKRRKDAVKNNTIWSSVCSGFNDPFEFRYLYLEEQDLVETGIPKEGKQMWTSIMEVIRKYVTTICFTQNPNSMPMWAHYANEHKGFCVEYEIINPTNLYPVIYTNKRTRAPGLFIELAYIIYSDKATKDHKKTIFNYLKIMNAFKEKSWEYENEVRAIFFNHPSQMSSSGRLCSCDEIGIKPTKIFVGVQCSKDDSDYLYEIAQEKNIAYERCELSTGSAFSVTSSNN